MAINLLGLNPEQYAAVIAPANSTSTLVLAGAGTGKTTVLTYRAAHLIQDRDIKPSAVLAVTFTNKAATELRTRLATSDLLGPQKSNQMWIGTFHSLCRKMLAERGVEAGIVPRGFGVIDQDSAVRLIRQERARMKDSELLPTGTHPKDARKFPKLNLLESTTPHTYTEFDFASGWDKSANLLKPEAVIHQIGKWKQDGISVEMVKDEIRKMLGDAGATLALKSPDYNLPDTMPAELLPILNTVWHYERYQQELAADRFLDFEDLLDKGVELLGHKTAGMALRQQFAKGEILVDEFQDTNDKQYEWLMRLSNMATGTCPRFDLRDNEGNIVDQTPIFAVGDDSQCHIKGSMVGTPYGQVAIECIKPRDKVTSLGGMGVRKTGTVIKVNKKVVTTKLVRVTLKNGAALTTTPEHVHFASKQKDISNSKNPVEGLVYIDLGGNLGGNLGRNSAAADNASATVHISTKESSVWKHIEEAGFSEQSIQLWSRTYFKKCATYADALAAANQLEKILYLDLGLKKNKFIQRIAVDIDAYLNFVQAKKVVPGMVMRTINVVGDINFSEIISVEVLPEQEVEVYDLDIDRTHNYAVNGVFSHNSIYSFRGSNPEYMQIFLEEVAMGNMVKLEQNYRSSPHILEIANNVISNNTDQIEKNLRSGVDAKAPTVHTPALASLDILTSNTEEAHHIVFGEGGILHRRSLGVPYSDMAVIYRTNMQGAPIEKQLREAAIPYVVYGGYSFYQRESVQTALAALKLAVAPDNDTCLRRIIGLQKGIGETSVAQLVADRDNGIASLLNKTAPAAVTPGLPGLFNDDDLEEAFVNSNSNSLAPNVTRPTFTVKDEYNGGNVKDPKTGKDLRVPLAYISPELESIARNLELNGSRESLFATIIARNNAIASGERPADMRQLKAQDAFADLASCIGALHLSTKATDVSLKDNNLTTILDLALSVLGIDDYYQKQDEAEKLEEGNRHTEYLTELRAHAMGFEDQVIAAIKLEQREAGIAEGSNILTASQQHRLNPETMIGEWLDQINLEASKQDNDSTNDSPDKLSLMTIHAAKGLEFNSVYVCGVVDGVLPHARAVQEDSELDDNNNPGVAEERRLFYVALTRAKKYLGVSAYTQRYDHVQKKNLPVATSEFLYEIPGNKVMLNDRRTKTHYSQHLPDLDLVNMGGYQREHAKHFKDATRAVPYGGSMPVFIRPELANEKYYANLGANRQEAANIEVEVGVEAGVGAGVGVRPDQASAPAGKITEFKDEYRFLSNFWPSPIVVEDKRYPTVEHFYQAMKSPDLAERARIAALPSPVDAKRAGAQLEKLRTDWDEVKLGVMEEGLKLKFQIPALKEKLLATGNKTIEEGNTWNDAFWGIDLKKQQGENHLGKLLMKVRDELRLEADLKNKGAAHSMDIPMRRRVVKPG